MADETFGDLTEEFESERDNAPSTALPSIPVFTMARYRESENRVFDADAQDRYLSTIAMCGDKALALAAAGVGHQTVSNFKKGNPEFAEAYKRAHAEWLSVIGRTIHKLAITGVLEPVTGRVGKDQDGVIEYVRKRDSKLLLALARRHDKEWQPHHQIDINAQVGVVVVSPPMSKEDWLAMGRATKLPLDPLEGLPGISRENLKPLTRGVTADDEQDET